MSDELEGLKKHRRDEVAAAQTLRRERWQRCGGSLVREGIFIDDGLVSSLSLVSGVARANPGRGAILLAGWPACMQEPLEYGPKAALQAKRTPCRAPAVAAADYLVYNLHGPSDERKPGRPLWPALRRTACPPSWRSTTWSRSTAISPP